MSADVTRMKRRAAPAEREVVEVVVGGRGGGHCAAPATEGPTSGGGGRPISLRVNAASRSNRRRSALSRRSGLGLDAGEFLCRPHPHSVPFLFFSAI